LSGVLDKKKISREIKQLQRVKTWQLVILLILAGFISATFLRLNNIGMVDRREAVIAADNAGDDKITQSRLYDLQRYVSAHMNTDLGKGVPLEASYTRDYQVVYEQAAGDVNPNGNIYKKVQVVCMPQFSHWSYAYIQCTTNELAKYPAAGNLVDLVQWPVPDNYVHAFASPVWSLDFAGWSLVVCGVILILIITRLIGVLILRLLLRHHYKSI